MSKIFDGGPAFPRERKFHYEADTKPGSGMIHDPPQDGMSLRDYFAAKALPELMSRLQTSDAETFKGEMAKVVGGLAYAFADAMLEVRKQ